MSTVLYNTNRWAENEGRGHIHFRASSTNLSQTETSSVINYKLIFKSYSGVQPTPENMEEGTPGRLPANKTRPIYNWVPRIVLSETCKEELINGKKVAMV